MGDIYRAEEFSLSANTLINSVYSTTVGPYIDANVNARASAELSEPDDITIYNFSLEYSDEDSVHSSDSSSTEASGLSRFDEGTDTTSQATSFESLLLFAPPPTASSFDSDLNYPYPWSAVYAISRRHSDEGSRETAASLRARLSDDGSSEASVSRRGSDSESSAASHSNRRSCLSSLLCRLVQIIKRLGCVIRQLTGL
ncbi:hypothetical protein NP233_g6167 [Leucocoprinus birnbaumii]|uniref:Uncharacterized protein n=1 Tax=Leucocoprinus birnbaumii TaxID=56174 RepID=A0AAD5VRG9_9AGAR|nr:hypothetical protein NP233_g6167 [Leucocoprinus birnbaumii]